MAKTIPIVTPEELESRDPFGEEADTIGVPMRVNVFERPDIPETEDKSAAVACRGLFLELFRAMKEKAPEAPNPLFALNTYSAQALSLINQTLGEGEVSIKVTEPDGNGFDEIRIVESVFIGVWRVQYFANGVQVADEIEVGHLPRVIASSAKRHAVRDLEKTDVTFPEGAMNSPAILAELKTVLENRQAGDAPFTINMSHLPMSEVDNSIINDTLGMGSVYMISKGMGNCHISSTLVPDVWRVQYYNNAQANLLILNTIVVTDLPQEALASDDDLADSARRLSEYADWLTENWGLDPVN